MYCSTPTTVATMRDTYGDGAHRFNRQLLAPAEALGFRPRLRSPYRAKTKSKVDRFT